MENERGMYPAVSPLWNRGDKKHPHIMKAELS